MDRPDLERLSRAELIELVLRLQRPTKTSRTSSKPPSTDSKERGERLRPDGAKPGHQGNSRTLSCLTALSGDLVAEIVSEHDIVELPPIAPVVERHRRLSVRCPSCGKRVAAALPAAAKGTPFGARVHAIATYLKTFQALSYERLCGAFADLFGLTISQGGLMNMLRRAQGHFAGGRDDAVSELRQARVVSSDETGVRIEGSNAWHWVFRCDSAVVHTAAPTRGAIVVRTMMDGHRSDVWCSDRYAAQQGHADAHQACLAHLARARAEAAGVSDRVKFELMDYRNLSGTFDRIVSVGMFEHVGPPHYGTFFKQCCERLTPDGVMLLHTIGRADGPGATDPWLAKYIFPGGYVPALSQMMPAIERSYLWLSDLEVLRLHYAYTLERWYDRVEAARAEIIALYDERFFRMWQFYLAGAISAFRNDGHVVFQLQLTRKRDAVPIVRDYIGVSETGLRQDGKIHDGG